MAASLRQQIVSAIITQMKTISTVNGYNSNLGTNVFDWKTSAWEAQEMPGISVEDGLEITTPYTLGNPANTQGTCWNELKIELRIAIQSGTTSAAVLRECIADVVKAIGTNFTFGLQNTYTLQDKTESLLIQDKNVLGGARVGFTIKYLSKYFSPYQ